MGRTDRASIVVDADLDRTFAALVDRAALERWLPPDGMTGAFERFDLRPGGSYRLVLRYIDPTAAAGKSSDLEDVVEARIVEVVPGDRVVQAVDFESDDPAFAGTMRMTWSVRAHGDGRTSVEIVAEDVPAGIGAADHAEGMRSSLEHLARHLAGG